MTKEIIEDAELAKSYITNSDLDDNCKKSLLRLVNISTMATNGLSVEEKIQKITEAIQGLVVSQTLFLNSVDKKIENANKEQCKSCKAMHHANEIEQQKYKDQLIEEWKIANGIKEDLEVKDNTWTGVLKKVISKPGLWVFLSIMVLSPYGVDIVKALLEFFAK